MRRFLLDYSLLGPVVELFVVTGLLVGIFCFLAAARAYRWIPSFLIHLVNVGFVEVGLLLMELQATCMLRLGRKDAFLGRS